MTQSGWYRDDPPRRQQPPPRRWGGLPKGIGVCIIIGFAALGALATAGAKTEPGLLLGLFVVIAVLAVVAAIGRRRRDRAAKAAAP